MWENRCKVAVSGVGFSKVTRSAEIPLAAHALAAVEEAIADLEAPDVRYRRPGNLPGTAGDRPRRGRRHLDRLGQLRMMARCAGSCPISAGMYPGRHDQHRRRGAAGGERAPRRRVQIRGGVAGDAQPARHLPEPSRRASPGCGAVHRALWLWRPGAGHGGRLYPLVDRASHNQDRRRRWRPWR